MSREEPGDRVALCRRKIRAPSRARSGAGKTQSRRHSGGGIGGGTGCAADDRQLPIVMASVIDPLDSGFVASLAHPGGNISGLSNMSTDISPKHLEMLVKTVPNLSSVAVLMNPANPAHPAILRSVQAATQRVGIIVLPAEAANPRTSGERLRRNREAARASNDLGHRCVFHPASAADRGAGGAQRCLRSAGSANMPKPAV